MHFWVICNYLYNNKVRIVLLKHMTTTLYLKTWGTVCAK